MKKTGVAVLCTNCGKEFELFADDGVEDKTVIWNWCPHCGKKNFFWLRFMVNTRTSTVVPLGISCEEAAKKFPKPKR